MSGTPDLPLRSVLTSVAPRESLEDGFGYLLFCAEPVAVFVLPPFFFFFPALLSRRVYFPPDFLLFSCLQKSDSSSMLFRLSPFPGFMFVTKLAKFPSAGVRTAL